MPTPINLDAIEQERQPVNLEDPALRFSSPGLYGPGPEARADAPEQSWGEFAKKAAPTLAGLILAPLGGGLAGMGAKKLIPGIASRALSAATQAGESLGSLATMGVEKGMKGEAPSAEEAGVWAALPMMGRAAGRLGGMAISKMRHLIPGHGIGEQAYAIEQAKENLGRAVKYGDYDTPYRALEDMWRKGNIENVPMPGVGKMASDESVRLGMLVGKLRQLGQEKLAQSIETLSAGGNAPINQIRENMRAMGPLMESSDADLANAATQYYKGLANSLRLAASGGSAQANTLLGANREYSRKILQDDLNRLLNRASRAENVDPRVAQFRPGMVQNPLQSPSTNMEANLADRFTKLMTDQEKEYFWQELSRLGKLSPATTSDPFSWKRRVPAGIMFGAVGGGLGSPGGPFGIGAGMAAGVGLEEYLAKAMRTEGGKSFIRKLMTLRGNNPYTAALGTGVGASILSSQE